MSVIYIKCFWLIAPRVLTIYWKMLFLPGIHVTSIYLLTGIVISVIWRDKSILWACKNKDYFLHSCSIFLYFKLFIQSIILRHTSVENFNHVKTFFTLFMLILMILRIFLHLDFVHLKKSCPYNLILTNCGRHKCMTPYAKN